VRLSHYLTYGSRIPRLSIDNLSRAIEIVSDAEIRHTEKDEIITTLRMTEGAEEVDVAGRSLRDSAMFFMQIGYIINRIFIFELI